MATINFDVIQYAKDLRTAGVSQEVADVQAQAIEKVIAEISNNQVLANKQDLINMQIANKQELVSMELRLVKWVLGTGAATILALAGIVRYLH